MYMTFEATKYVVCELGCQEIVKCDGVLLLQIGNVRKKSIMVGLGYSMHIQFPGKVKCGLAGTV